MTLGVFDSGIGGLSVHRKLVDRFPELDFIYLADQKNTPYGGRGGEEIVALTQAGCARLFDAGGPAVPIRKALELAAEKLAVGQPVPQAAVSLMAKAFIPGWMYRLIGGFGWKQQAKHYHAEKMLKKQPYPRETSR